MSLLLFGPHLCDNHWSGGLLGETVFGKTVFAQGILQGAAEASSHRLLSFFFIFQVFNDRNCLSLSLTQQASFLWEQLAVCKTNRED